MAHANNPRTFDTRGRFQSEVGGDERVALTARGRKHFGVHNFLLKICSCSAPTRLRKTPKRSQPLASREGKWLLEEILFFDVCERFFRSRGEEDELVYLLREEAILLHPFELRLEPVVEAVGIEKNDGFFVHRMFLQLKDVCCFVQRPDAAREDGESIRALRHNGLPLAEVFRDYHLIGICAGMRFKDFHRDTDNFSALLLRGRGYHL